MSDETETQDVKKEETTSNESSTEEELEVETTEETQQDVTEEVDPKEAALQARLNELSEDNRRQKALLEQVMMMGMGNRQTGDVIQDDGDADIDPALAKRLKLIERRATQQVQGVLSGVLEEMDKTAILSSPKANLYRKYQQDVDNFRNSMASQGRFFKREEALAAVLFNKDLVGEKPIKPVKKIVKQQVKAAGVTTNAAPVKSKTTQPQTVKERLANKKF